MAAVLTYQTSAVSTADATTYTFSGKAIGTAADNRYVIVAVTGGYAGRTVSTLTVGGITATKLVELVSTAGSSELTSALFIVLVTTGTTADVVVTWSAGQNDCGIGIWSATGISATALDTKSSNASPGTFTLTTVAGGVVVCAHNATGTGTTSWTNTTERYDAVVEDTIHHSGSDAAPGGSTLAVTATYTGSPTKRPSVGASFQPPATQALTPSIFTESDTFYTPKVSHGLRPSLFSETDTFFTPVVALTGSTQALTASLFADTNTFYAPALTVGASPLTPSLFTDTNTFYTPTITTGSVNLSPALFRERALVATVRHV
jgi:hypothetical protein